MVVKTRRFDTCTFALFFLLVLESDACKCILTGKFLCFISFFERTHSRSYQQFCNFKLCSGARSAAAQQQQWRVCARNFLIFYFFSTLMMICNGTIVQQIGQKGKCARVCCLERKLTPRSHQLTDQMHTMLHWRNNFTLSQAFPLLLSRIIKHTALAASSPSCAFCVQWQNHIGVIVCV